MLVIGIVIGLAAGLPAGGKLMPETTPLITDLPSSSFMGTAARTKIVNESYNGFQITLASDYFLVVELESNPSTGYRWHLMSNSKPAVLEEVSHGYQPPQSGAPGASGKEIWTFRTKAAGYTILRMDYRSQPDTPGNKLFELMVVVSNP